MSALKLHRERTAQTKFGPLSYLVHQPPGFAEEPRPLVLFLHGVGERGSDLSRVATHGIPALIERGKNFPFVAVSPQCPADFYWGELTEALVELLSLLDPALHIDRARVYLTGISMGGFGAFKLAACAPETFAAMVSICGGGEESWAPALASLPTWLFHGAQDDVVPAASSQRMFSALEAVGAPVKLTLYDDLSHACWDRAFQTPELFDWLLSQRRSDAAPPMFAR
jgi:predicted peptidase